MTFSLLVAIAVLLHEGGHFFALCLLGGKIAGVRLSPVGITLLTKQSFSYLKECVLFLAGPLVGLLAFFLFAKWEGSLRLFAEINLFLSLFNLLPIDKLDGGKALASFLSLFLSRVTVDRIVSLFSWIFLILLWLVAVFFALFFSANLSLYALSLWLFCQNVLKNESA